MLRALVLLENPCSDEGDYRVEVLVLLPSLERLDKDFYEEEEKTEAEETRLRRREEELELERERERERELELVRHNWGGGNEEEGLGGLTAGLQVGRRGGGLKSGV